MNNGLQVVSGWPSAGFCVLLMAGAWLFARKRDFYSLVDAVWAYGIGLCALLQLSLGSAPLARKPWSAAWAVGWSLRLGTHLSLRLKRHYPQEDARYAEIKRGWVASGASVHARFFLFFQFQALSQIFLSIPFLLLAGDPAPFPRATEVAGGCLAAMGILGEAAADLQLKRFTRDPASRSRVCQVGWWRYSRHPNYFFEWIVWCGFGLLGAGAPGGVWAWLAPSAMLLLLLFVTGVPPAEKSSLRSRGKEYVRYQLTTSKFIPWPRRH